MKKVLSFAAVAAVSIFAATQVFAQAATQDIDVKATVGKYCKIGGEANPAKLTKTIPIDAATNDVDTTAIDFAVGSVVCNTATDITTSSAQGSVKGPANTNTSFANKIDYVATAKLGTAGSTIDTATPANSAAGATTGAYSGDLAVKIAPVANAKPLVGGSYLDTLTVTLTPKP